MLDVCRFDAISLLPFEKLFLRRAVGNADGVPIGKFLLVYFLCYLFFLIFTLKNTLIEIFYFSSEFFALLFQGRKMFDDLLSRRTLSIYLYLLKEVYVVVDILWYFICVIWYCVLLFWVPTIEQLLMSFVDWYPMLDLLLLVIIGFFVFGCDKGSGANVDA